jgi:hypothetical protein
MSCGYKQTVGLLRVTKGCIAFRLQCQAVQEERSIRTLAPPVVTQLLTAMYDEQIL